MTFNAASVLTRFGVFQAGLASAKDPKYVVVPQRERMRRKRRPYVVCWPGDERPRRT